MVTGAAGMEFPFLLFATSEKPYEVPLVRLITVAPVVFGAKILLTTAVPCFQVSVRPVTLLTFLASFAQLNVTVPGAVPGIAAKATGGYAGPAYTVVAEPAVAPLKVCAVTENVLLPPALRLAAGTV